VAIYGASGISLLQPEDWIFPGNFYAIKNVGHLGNKNEEFYQGGEKLQGKRRIPRPARTKRRSGHKIPENETDT